MNRGDIKLLIDQLNGIELGYTNKDDDWIIQNAINMLETLGNKVAEQAAVIEKQREALQTCQKKQIIYECSPAQNYKTYDSELVSSALAIQPDSKAILAEWLDGALGEPVGEVHKAHTKPVLDMEHWCKEILLYSPNNPHDLPKNRIPLFKKPEMK